MRSVSNVAKPAVHGAQQALGPCRRSAQQAQQACALLPQPAQAHLSDARSERAHSMILSVIRAGSPPGMRSGATRPAAVAADSVATSLQQAGGALSCNRRLIIELLGSVLRHPIHMQTQQCCRKGSFMGR